MSLYLTFKCDICGRNVLCEVSADAPVNEPYTRPEGWLLARSRMTQKCEYVCPACQNQKQHRSGSVDYL